MVILTGKAFRIVYQQINFFFVLFFVFGRKKVFFVFVSVSANKFFFRFIFRFRPKKGVFRFCFGFGKKKEIDFFSCFYFWAENGKFIFGWPLVPGFCHRKFLDLQIAMGGFEGIIIG